jgi:hypothetical protein
MDKFEYDVTRHFFEKAAHVQTFVDPFTLEPRPVQDITPYLIRRGMSDCMAFVEVAHYLGVPYRTGRLRFEGNRRKNERIWNNRLLVVARDNVRVLPSKL